MSQLPLSQSPGDSTSRALAAPARAPWLGTAIHLGLAVLVILFASSLVFYQEHRLGNVSDSTRHIRIVQQGIEKNEWPSHGVYHLLVASLAGFRADQKLLRISAFFVLIFMASAKLVATMHMIGSRVQRVMNLDTHCKPLAATALSIVTVSALCVQFVMPIMWQARFYEMMIGTIAPTVWHNPTYVFSMPFALLCFYFAARSLVEDKAAAYVGVALSAFASAASKPTFVLAFLPAYCVASVWFARDRWLALGKCLLAVTPCVLVLSGQFLWVYANPGQAGLGRGRGIVFAPMVVSRMHVDDWRFLVGLIASFAFPAAYLLLYRRQFDNKPELGLAWLCAIAGMLWCTLFAETDPTGEINRNRNIFGVSTAANAVLFVATLADFLANALPRCTQSARSLLSVRFALVAGLFALHVLSGLLYYSADVIGKINF